VPGADGTFESFVTLLLADQAPELAAVHDELYPARVPEGIPLSITLLYPFVPAPALGDAESAALREFFASRPTFSFEIRRVAQWDGGGAVYGVPEPDDELRATMRALWERYPEHPPYGERGGDPPPHASLTLDGGPDPGTLRERVQQRLASLLPARFDVREATLMEEYEPDRYRVRQTFRFSA
jgi:2'-5' RNA ligase superfamily